MEIFIERIAKKKRFAKKDVKIILEGMIEVFTEHAQSGQPLKIRGLGTLYVQKIPARKGRNGESLPETNRVIFRLSENIRSTPNKKEKLTLDKI